MENLNKYVEHTLLKQDATKLNLLNCLMKQNNTIF